MFRLLPGISDIVPPTFANSRKSTGLKTGHYKFAENVAGETPLRDKPASQNQRSMTLGTRK